MGHLRAASRQHGVVVPGGAADADRGCPRRAGVEKAARARGWLLRTQAVVLGSQRTREHSTTAACIHSLRDPAYAPCLPHAPAPRCCAAPSTRHNPTPQPQPRFAQSVWYLPRRTLIDIHPPRLMRQEAGGAVTPVCDAVDEPVAF